MEDASALLVDACDVGGIALVKPTSEERRADDSFQLSLCVLDCKLIQAITPAQMSQAMLLHVVNHISSQPPVGLQLRSGPAMHCRLYRPQSYAALDVWARIRTRILPLVEPEAEPCSYRRSTQIRKPSSRK